MSDFNFAKLCLQYGGSIHPLIIPAEENSGLGLMNPSVYIHNGKVLVNLRAVNYTFYHSEKKLFQHPYGPLTYIHPENDVHLRTWNHYLELDENYEIIRHNKIDTSKFPDKELWDFVGLEDARLFEWEGKMFTCGVRRDLDPTGIGRMELCEIDIQEDKVVQTTQIRIEPPENPNSYCEKNWMPVLDKPYHFIKWSNPTELVVVNPEDGTSKFAKISEKREMSGYPRGGSQVIPWKDYYIAFTHEVDLFKSETQRKDAVYKHRILLWDRDFNLIRWTDTFSLMGGDVEFAVGLAQQGSDFLLTFGFQDNAAFLLKFPESVIEEQVLNAELNNG